MHDYNKLVGVAATIRPIKKLFSTGLRPGRFSFPFILPSKPNRLFGLLISSAPLNTISKKFLSTNRG